MRKCRQALSTAAPQRSIWLDLPENTFRGHLVTLEERTNAVPMDQQIFLARDWLLTTKSTLLRQHLLPIEVEQQIADHFASLVALEEGAQSVAAVCLEQRLQPSGLTLRFAALDIEDNTDLQDALSVICRILGRAADFPGSDDLELLFNRVVELHSRRLVARLRSSKWSKPKYLNKSHKKPLWQDFHNLAHRVQFLYTKKENTLSCIVKDLISQLGPIYEEFEHTSLDDQNYSLKELVISSFKFFSREEIKDYTNRLENSTKLPTPQIASAIKCLRQIQKISASRRMCIFLRETAAQYSSLFQNISLAYLPPYENKPTEIAYEEWARTSHIHAEIQLAVFYDLTFDKSLLKPRCIGISKWLCYLCYQFLRHHAQFFPSKTHGRLYDQWTVPDLEGFGDDIVFSYRRILKEIDQQVVDQTEQEPELWRVEPMTSVDIYDDPAASIKRFSGN